MPDNKTSRIDVSFQPENKRFLERLKREFKSQNGRTISFSDILDEMVTQLREKTDAEEVSSKKELLRLQEHLLSEEEGAT